MLCTSIIYMYMLYMQDYVAHDYSQWTEKFYVYNLDRRDYIFKSSKMCVYVKVPRQRSINNRK